MIRTKDLIKHYEDGRIRALDGVTIEIPRGEFLCIMGPSGSGKSTFLNMVGALDHPTSGEVVLNGRALSNEPDLDRVRAQEVGFVFQLHNLMPTLTAVENVEIPMFAVGLPRRERRRRATGLLEKVGLAERLHSIATKLSGGERQRVAIARALANEPSVLLADEPTGDVDSATGAEIMQALLGARGETGATLVVVTHNPDIAADADRLVRMKDGKFTDS
ncbi:MAG: ABC transporter ATP-binding protein [Planctomycetota bacterium]|jgi:putative ABC transport system ATP-binding protein